jgi:signal transduction histidine kinase
VRALTIVFVSLVALPGVALGWLGFRYADTLEQQTRRTIERETEAAFDLKRRQTQQAARETEAQFERRAEEVAREVARLLPDADAPDDWRGFERAVRTPLGVFKARIRVETARGEPLAARRELAELPEWPAFVAARDAALLLWSRDDDRAAAAKALHSAADEFRSPRLRAALVDYAGHVATDATVADEVGVYTAGDAALPHGAHLALRVYLPPAMRAASADGAGLGWKEATLGPFTRAGLYIRVRVDHPDADRFASDIGRRKLLTITAIGALLLLMVVGLWLARRALVRESAARRLRDAFIANVSHELKTPLTSVRMYAEMLADGGVGDAKRREYGRVVDAEGARLAALVDDMLDFSALERGARELEVEPTDVARLAHATAEAWRPLAEREGVALEVDGPREGESALADPAALGRILANLLQNALRHGRPARDGGPALIRVSMNGDLSVSNNGPPIPPSERAAIFERFRRGADAGNRAGAGIGLALSRELARAMNGNLMVEDDGTWTRFTLRLPPVPDEPA